MSTIEKAAARLTANSNAKPTEKPFEASEPERTPANTLESFNDASDDTLRNNNIFEQMSEQDEVHNPEQDAGSSIRKSDKKCELEFQYLADNGFLVPGFQNNRHAHEFRRIKRSLLLNQQPKLAAKMPLPTNVIFVTSALPGEGKTFASFNLALSLAAELDKEVLLIDGDAAKGDLSRWMSIDTEIGLVDILTSGRSSAEEDVIDTNIERFSVMSCGKNTDNLDELYASSLMTKFLADLANFNKDRMIIVDGPPLLATTEAAVLAFRMGQVVMVVEANKTPQNAVEQAVSQIANCQLVNLLLNKGTAGAGSSYGYGYGYGYGYSYGYGYGKSA